MKLADLLHLEKPFVVYQKPQSNHWIIWIQQSDEVFEYSSLSDGLSGFVFHAFNSKKNCIFPVHQSTIEQCEPSFSEKKTPSYNTLTSENQKEKEHHIQLVRHAVETIQSSDLEKVVLSRIEKVPTNSKPPHELFEALAKQYQTAFVYWWYHPKIGMWAGATPEQLIKCTEDKIETVALAGTQLYSEQKTMHWGTKEQEEQAIVTTYIKKTLENYSKEVYCSPPYTYRAGKLAHIKTDIAAYKVGKIQQAKIIENLHPTPALCGYPKEKALDYILENEGYNREYYGGFLGEWNLDANPSTDLYVNLRCMQLFDTHIGIYVGGGINAKSNPSDEWEETKNKTSTIKKIL